jgi:hypothetical protein
MEGILVTAGTVVGVGSVFMERKSEDVSHVVDERCALMEDKLPLVKIAMVLS